MAKVKMNEAGINFSIGVHAVSKITCKCIGKGFWSWLCSVQSEKRGLSTTNPKCSGFDQNYIWVIIYSPPVV